MRVPSSTGMTKPRRQKPPQEAVACWHCTTKARRRGGGPGGRSPRGCRRYPFFQSLMSKPAAHVARATETMTETMTETRSVQTEVLLFVVGFGYSTM